MRRLDLLKEQLSFLRENAPDSPKIEELEKSLSFSKRGRSSKIKGANFERKIVKVLQENFPTLTFGRTPSSGGYKKEVENSSLRGDVVCLSDNVDFLLHLELKNRKGWESVKNWYLQSEGDCIKGKIPCLIMHQGQVAGKFKAKDFILIELDDFFKIVDKSKLLIKK